VTSLPLLTEGVFFTVPFLIQDMAITSIKINEKEHQSGASLLPADCDTMTYLGIGAGVLTLGGTAFVGAAVMPAQAAGGIFTTAGLLGASEIKRRTGSYLPFLATEKQEQKAADPINVTPPQEQPEPQPA